MSDTKPGFIIRWFFPQTTKILEHCIYFLRCLVPFLVEPNMSKEDRVIISFNINKEKIPGGINDN